MSREFQPFCEEYILNSPMFFEEWSKALQIRHLYAEASEVLIRGVENYPDDELIKFSLDSLNGYQEKVKPNSIDQAKRGLGPAIAHTLFMICCQALELSNFEKIAHKYFRGTYPVTAQPVAVPLKTEPQVKEENQASTLQPPYNCSANKNPGSNAKRLAHAAAIKNRNSNKSLPDDGQSNGPLNGQPIYRRVGPKCSKESATKGGGRSKKKPVHDQTHTVPTWRQASLLSELLLAPVAAAETSTTDFDDYEIYYPRRNKKCKTYLEVTKCRGCNKEFPCRGKRKPIEYYQHCIKECPQSKPNGK